MSRISFVAASLTAAALVTSAFAGDASFAAAAKNADLYSTSNGSFAAAEAFAGTGTVTFTPKDTGSAELFSNTATGENPLAGSAEFSAGNGGGAFAAATKDTGVVLSK